VTRLLPEFETITYGELWRLACAAVAEWVSDTDDPCRPGDFVTILGFNGEDFITLDIASLLMGAVVVPLPPGGPAGRMDAIRDDVAQLIVAAGADYLGAAVEEILLGASPRRLIVFDFHPRIDDHRAAIADARSRLAAM